MVAYDVSSSLQPWVDPEEPVRQLAVDFAGSLMWRGWRATLWKLEEVTPLAQRSFQVLQPWRLHRISSTSAYAWQTLLHPLQDDASRAKPGKRVLSFHGDGTKFWTYPESPCKDATQHLSE